MVHYPSQLGSELVNSCTIRMNIENGFEGNEEDKKQGLYNQEN